MSKLRKLNKKKIIITFFVITIFYLLASFIVSFLTFKRLDKQLNFENQNYINLTKQSKDEKKVIKVENKNFIYHVFKAKEKTNNEIILAHGVTSNKSDVSYLAKILNKNGFNVIVFDHRYHGENKKVGNWVGFGVLEKDDINKIINNELKQNPKLKFGLYGVSMGAASVVNYGIKYNKQDKVKGIVAESCFKDMYNQMNKESKSTLFTGINMFRWGVDMWFKLIKGYSSRQNQILANITKLKVPLDLISPKNDPRINSNDTVELEKHANSNVTKFIFPGNRHAKSYLLKNKDQWSNHIVKDFKNYFKIKD